MNKLLEQAIAAASNLSDDGQTTLARRIMGEAKRLAILEGVADADAGRAIPHANVMAWAESLGTEAEKPVPTCK